MLTEDSKSLNPFFSPRKVLVADDFEDSRLLIKFLLSEEGWEVIEAKDGFEALSLIEQTQFYLLILDNLMPRLIGIEVYQLLREKGINLSVILLSAHPDLKDLALSLGIKYFLPKVFNLSDFLDLVELAYDSSAHS